MTFYQMKVTDSRVSRDYYDFQVWVQIQFLPQSFTEQFLHKTY